jgi:hypothetical protein
VSSALARLLVIAALGTGLAIPASASALGPPTIESTAVTEVTATSANLGARINPNGLVTSYRFEYISEAAFRANVEAEPPKDGFNGASFAPPAGTPKVGASGLATVVQHLGSLTPATSYRFRLWLSNSAGTITGSDHAFASQETSLAFQLPDNRAWELVSPVDKNGGGIQGPGQIFGGGLDQAAAQGGAFTYSAATAFGDAPGAPPGSQYLATRTASGWSTQNVSTPLQAGAYGEDPDGVPYRLFSADLDKGLLYGGECQGEEAECGAGNPPSLAAGAPAGYANYYLRNSANGSFSALLGQGNVEESPLGPKSLLVSAVGAGPDLSHVVLASCAALTSNASEAPGECDPEEENLYEWSTAGLELLNLLPGESEGTPGAAIAASLGAISEDGSRVYWSLEGNLYLSEGDQSFQVDEAQGGGGSFQAASTNGSIAYFTRAGHLYRYSTSSHAVTDLTPSGGVTGVLGSSKDGSTIYYQDAAGLWRWHEGTLTKVAGGADATLASDYPPAIGTARVTPDGSHLAFLSDAPITGYENAGQTEAFLYGPPVGSSTPELFCVSCNPTGETATGAAVIPGAPPGGGSPLPYKPRALSADGTRVFFETTEKLAIQDTNAAPDLYQWEAAGAGSCGRVPGCVRLLSSGRSREGATFLDASADGSDVFFLTDGSLVGSDPGSIDAYDARVGGGLAEAPKPISCTGDACQVLPEAPEDPTPGTLTPSSGNQALAISNEKPKKKRHHKKRGAHHHKHQKGRRSR